MTAKNTNEWVEPKELPSEKIKENYANYKLSLGVLARFFKTPIPHFEGMNDDELGEWMDVMAEIQRRERDAQQRAVQAMQKR